MDKIQELHGKLFLQEQSVGEYMKDHATITEDMMGRFAEWKDTNGWVFMKSENVFLNSEGPLTPVTTSELIKLFKQQL